MYYRVLYRIIPEVHRNNGACRTVFAKATACQVRLPLRASSRVRGSASPGVKVIDDFGHQPTAITQTLTGLRRRCSGHRIWAVLEPRSNTTRRAVFQQELPVALGLVDGVFLSEVARLEQIPVDERLHPEAVIEAIAATGKPAFYEKNADATLRRLVPLLRKNDSVVVFSNGGFDGFTGSCSHSSQHKGFNSENSTLLFGSRDDFGVRAAGRNGAGTRRGAGRFRFDSAALCYSSAG